MDKRIDYQLLLKMISDKPADHWAAYQSICSPLTDQEGGNNEKNNIRNQKLK